MFNKKDIMFYFWYTYLYRYYSSNIKKLQRILRPLLNLILLINKKIANRLNIKYLVSLLLKKSKTDSGWVAMIVFIFLALNLSFILSGISKNFYKSLWADSNVIVEAIDIEESLENQIAPSINDANLDSYDYYQNLNMEAKSEDFLDLYLIEDRNFLARSIDLTEVGIDVSKPDQIITYVVKSGDTLAKIAKQFDINVETIRTANSLKKNTINPGQELIILPISGIYYTIKKGDTLNSLAIKYKISATVIREYNNLENDTLKIGQKIVLPGAKAQVVVSSGSNISSATKITESSVSGSDFFMYPTVGWNWGTAHGTNNSAVDIANACGTPIYASADGIVITVKTGGYNGGYGLYIKIQHNNGTSTLYAHLSQILVTNGQYVTKGQMIGKMGTTGKSTGCHLHFEVHGVKNPFIKK